ncbi:hypothetical protein [Actinomadura nitritigenes]|uniref:hypothetical protein n=1 Tax=Actinomadura nitritigenes TaxID=134602 RepID=UPI003D935735
MQQRAIDTALTALTGTALAGMLVAGVAVESAHGAPADKPMAHNLTSQQVTGHDNNTNTGKTSGKTSGKTGGKTKAGKAAPKTHAVLSGNTTASYFWDDGSGVNGDTGAPASGKPMQKGMFASPSWPMNTKVKVTYQGRSVTGFVGDRGPGEPSHRGVMLDLDTYTFRHLVDGKKPTSKYDTGTSAGHLKGVKYEVLSWGHGAGTKGTPKPLG